MKDVEFNLIDSPWIQVIGKRCDLKEVSIREVLLNSNEYTGIRGELPAQDAAIMRLLLAILLRVFLEKDQNGNNEPLTIEKDQTWVNIDPTDAFARWTALWEEGRFPAEPINEYLDTWHERFWLFHPEFPFYQVPDIQGTEYEAKKLNGSLSISENKNRLFRSRTDETKNILTYPEAARWLIYLNAYDDASGKPFKKNKAEKYPSTGVGWLGKIGLVYPEGKTLFQTLMLNLTFLKNGGEAWESGHPAWENDVPKREQRTQIPIPGNPTELLTLQSRRLLLKRAGGIVYGYTGLGGDFFSMLNADTEQMTAWVQEKNGKNTTGNRKPKKHDIDMAMWREFPSLIAGENDLRPGVIKWLEKLSMPGSPLAGKVINFRTVSIVYGDSNGSVEDIHSDSLGMHAGILAKLVDQNSGWIKEIKDQVQKCEYAAFCLRLLEKDILSASGSNLKEIPASASEQYFERIDIPFRRWLFSLDPDKDMEDLDDLVTKWEDTSRGIAMKIGESLAANAAPVAFTGRLAEKETGSRKKKKDQETDKVYVSTPEAFNRFSFLIWKTYPRKGDK